MPTVLAPSTMPGFVPQPFLGAPAFVPDVPPGQPLELVDPTFQALRTSIRPLDANPGPGGVPAGGHFRCGITNATNFPVNLAANSIIFSFLWTNIIAPPMYCVIERIRISACPQTAVTSPNQIDFQAFVFRGATGAASGANSIAASITKNSQKNRITFVPSLVKDFRICGAVTLTAATGKTNDSNPFASGALGTGGGTVGALGTAYLPLELYKADAFGGHPLVLSPNEGFEIQNVTAVVNSGTMQYYVDVEWAEVGAY